MPVSESSPAIEIILVLTIKQPTCLPSHAAAERLGNEKLTTLTNLNFDSLSRRNVQWFSSIPHFFPPSLATWSLFSSCKFSAVNYLFAISLLRSSPFHPSHNYASLSPSN